ncbi:MAG: NifU family protein [Cyclobacteriaceae bacterium]|nr:NifU family protein [Cyclobacteriaceae bacterium]
MIKPIVVKKEEIISRVESALDSIRPYLEADGGNVRVVEIDDDNILRLEFVGACGNCPMSTMTFKAGVEEAIKRAVPEVVAIEVVNLTTA